MKYRIATGTVTYALKGRDLLRANGYNATVKRMSSDLKEYGCGYVIITDGDIERALQLLQNNGIKILKTEDITSQI